MGLSYYVDLPIVVNGKLSVREGHQIAHTFETKVLNALPQVSEVLVHVEPEEELAMEWTTKSQR
jgi:divalent metal cation (Fe/Co/Zn/Cd) transporter